MSCDICGKVGSELIALLDVYKSADVQHVCQDCERILNAKSSQLLTVVMNIKRYWMKRFIRELKDKR